MPRMWDYIRGPGLTQVEDAEDLGYDTMRVDPRLAEALIAQNRGLGQSVREASTTGRAHMRRYYLDGQEAVPDTIGQVLAHAATHRADDAYVDNSTFVYGKAGEENYVEVVVAKVHTTANLGVRRYQVQAVNHALGVCMVGERDGGPDFSELFNAHWFPKKATATRTASTVPRGPRAQSRRRLLRRGRPRHAGGGVRERLRVQLQRDDELPRGEPVGGDGGADVPVVDAHHQERLPGGLGVTVWYPE